MQHAPTKKKRSPGPMGNGTTIRLGDRLEKRVRQIAGRHGVKASLIIRAALLNSLPAWEARGVSLPSSN
jgi:predicted transcriptional regulator